MTPTVLSVFGTRPEAIKMAPVVHELAHSPQRVRSLVCVTAQHRQMLDQVLELFDIRPDFDLDVMQERQSLAELTARVMLKLEPVIVKPDWLSTWPSTIQTHGPSRRAIFGGHKPGSRWHHCGVGPPASPSQKPGPLSGEPSGRV